jgi:hypothetical protein
MNQDYRLLSDEQIEQLEKATVRTAVQAVQEYSKEAKHIFDNTYAPSDNEVIVLAEDITQYALEVAECYPINKRYAGFIDYKRVRWMPTPFGLIPQALLVDAKASTESNRDTLQRSQLPMDAEFISNGKVHHMQAGVSPHLDIDAHGAQTLRAVATSEFVHFFYEKLNRKKPPFRKLKSIFLLALPHANLKHIYNPDPKTTFFGQGKHSPSLKEEPRIRVYFNRLREMQPWRLQELSYEDGSSYTVPRWRDRDTTSGEETILDFKFIGR